MEESDLSIRVRCFLVIFIFLSGSSYGEDFTLTPIVKDASPVDSLSEDPVIPAKREQTGISSGSGSVQQTLEDELPFSVTDPGRAGSLAQFRGLGDRAEDTNVQALGIPLNGAQGGGFDLSTFPQYFWSDYRFALTPSLGALDPRGVSGTLTLIPWSAKALESSETRPRWSALYAGSDLQQISVAEKYEDRAAILAGYSSGLPVGPTGSTSIRIFENNQLDLKFHLLATKIDSELYGFGSASAPHQTTDRVIPVVQADWTPSAEVLIKSSFFYDNTFIHYDDPSNAYYTRDRAQQWGIENAAFIGDWKFGLSTRSVYYNGTAFSAPAETVSNALLSRTMKWETSSRSRLILDPAMQGVYVSNFGAHPEATLGVREEWGEREFAIYSRGSYSRRFPTLADLYYSVPGFGSIPGVLGNPALEPEDDFTYVLGCETQSGIWSGSLQGYYQLRDNAQALVSVQNGANTELQNAGQARIASLTATGGVELGGRARIWDSLAWTHSRVDELSSPFPYVPNLVNLLGMNFVALEHWTIGATIRTQTSSYVSTSAGSLAGVSFGDAQVAYAGTNGFQIVGRAENLTGDPLVLSYGYPAKGRVLSVSVIGPF